MFMCVRESKNRGSVFESHGRPYFLFSLSKFTSQRRKGRGGDKDATSGSNRPLDPHPPTL